MTEIKKEIFDTPQGKFVHVDGKMHSVDDEPAIVYKDGTKWWYQNGAIHRDGGPAIVWHNGVEEWFHNNQRHRTDGPAVIYPDNPVINAELRGVRQFWERGQLIREEVPPALQAYRAELLALRRKYGFAT